MTTLWVDKYSNWCGNCDYQVTKSWGLAEACDECGTVFTKIGTHFLKDPHIIRMIIQSRPDLEWAGVHPEKWKD
jgi:hypothetical protein